MMEMQQQPSMDTPAEEQAPVVERVLETAKQVQPEDKSGVFWPVVFSYILSIGSGVLTAYLINIIFGSPYTDALLPINDTLWRIGIPLSLIVSFLLGFFLPFFFAKTKRLKAMFITGFCLFFTLIVLVIVGLSQISPENLFSSLVLH